MSFLLWLGLIVRVCQLVSVHTRDHSFQVADKLLPAVARALIGGVLVGTEARVLHTHKRSAFGRDQRPFDDTPQSEGTPAIRDLFVGFDDLDFAIDYAVPIG